MSTQKEEVIIEFKIDQGAALSDLKKVEKAILENKEAQKELNEEYKKGAITQDEYVERNVELTQALKKEQEERRSLSKLIDTESNSRNALKAKVSALTKEYDNLNRNTAEGKKRSAELEKELSTLNTQITKTSKSAGLFKDQIGNYPEKFKEAVKEIEIAGVSVGSLGTKLASFINPVTASVALIGALGKVYSESTLGAKDLEFATSELEFTFKQFANTLGRAGGGGEEGKGFFSRIAGFFSSEEAKVLTKRMKELEDIQREFNKLRAEGNERLENNADLLTKVGLEQTSYNEKLEAFAQIQDNLKKNGEEQLGNIDKQIQFLKDRLSFDKDDETIQGLLNDKILERSQVSRQINRLEEASARQRDNIVDAENKRVSALEKQEKILTDIDQRSSKIKSAQLPGQPSDSLVDYVERGFYLDRSSYKQILIHTHELNKAVVDINKKSQEEITENQKKELEVRAMMEDQAMENSVSILGSIGSVLKKGGNDYKVVASLQTAISTYAAAQKAFESQASIPVVGPELGAIAAAAAIIRGLENLAAINGIQFAEGGFTGHGGKYEPAGIVHKGEVVWNQTDVAMAGGALAANAIRPTFRGYADGGIVTGSLVRETNTSIMQMNALKAMPAPEVSVKEISLVQKRVAVKELVSSL